MRILLLNLGSESTRAVRQALSDQGYDIAAEHNLTVDEVLGRTPELLITEATPSNLSCCGVITQIKASSHLQALKIVMIVHGEGLERARGLDLGADDVVTFPFEPLEFAAKIRVQIRQRQPELELEAELEDALGREHLAESTVDNLINKVMSRRRFWVLSIVCVLSAATLLAAATTVISNHHSRKDTLQLKANVARLNDGLLQQRELLLHAEPSRDSLNVSGAPGTRESSQTHTEHTGKKIAANGADTNDESLARQLESTQNRLDRLENEDRIAETIVQTYGPSVCFLHVVVGFRDKASGQLIRLDADDTGKARVDDKGMASLDTGGTGPPLQLDFFGTGFLVTSDGRLLTNHHVAEPWVGDMELKQILDLGAVPFVVSYMAYFPGTSQGIAAKLDRISRHADLATLRLQKPAPPHAAVLEIDDRSEASVTGDPVLLIGYPTGIEGILARAGSDVVLKVAETAQDVPQMLSQMAAQRLIRPTTTQGHIGDVLTDTIVYDAATTSGGSGGPLFNRDGKVIGVNSAILKDFGGSNLAVPIRFADELLK